MIKNFKIFLEKSVWPKIAIWEAGQDVQASNVMGSMLSDFYNKLMDGIKMGYIIRLEKTSKSVDDKEMKITLSNGNEKVLKLKLIKARGLTPMNIKWSDDLGLTQMYSEDPKKIEVLDWDYVMSTQGYMKLIHEYEFNDITTKRNRTEGAIVLQGPMLPSYRFNSGKGIKPPHNELVYQLENRNTYKIFTTGKILCKYYDHQATWSLVNRVQNLKNSIQEFEKLFNIVIERLDQDIIEREKDKKKCEEENIAYEEEFKNTPQVDRETF